MNVFKLHLRPEGLAASDVVEHCLTNSLMGVGWTGPEQVADEKINDYLVRHEAKWGYRERSVHGLMQGAKVGDYIWARDARGGYLLGRVENAPYVRFGDRKELRDMHHVVDVELLGGQTGEREILLSEVPGSIQSYFSRRGAAFHKILDADIRKYTDWIFCRKTGRELPQFEPMPFMRSLTAFELEDLVVLYLQFAGWKVVLSSHTKSTPRYEVCLIKSGSGTAGVQVKHGNVTLLASDYIDDPAVDHTFLYANSGNYGREVPESVSIIGASQLLNFAMDNRDSLPRPIRFWLDISLEAMQR